MSTRTLPKPDIYATCPNDGGVLEYYSGVFESVYVCLNPFIKPTHISPERFCPETYPSNSELLTLCDPVSWAEIMRQSGLPSFAAVDIALKTQILAIREQFMNQEYSKKLECLYETGIAMPPCEGEQSPFLLRPVMTIFKDLGHDWAWVGDEFCTERKLHWVDELAAPEANPIIGHANVFSPDRSLLWSVHWDSHFTFLCGSRADLERAKVSNRIEGFYCTSDTRVYWSLR